MTEIPGMLRGAINHLDLTVRDPHASAPFYDAVLGFLGFARVRLAGDPNPVWQSRDPDGLKLELVHMTEPPALGDASRGGDGD